MQSFSKKITDFWLMPFLNGDVLYDDGLFTVAISVDLSEDRRVMVLEMSYGRTIVVLTSALAHKLCLYHQQNLSEAHFRRKLKEANVTLHGADYLFYFSETSKNALLQESPDDVLRKLTEQDAAVFSEFQSSASEQDLDDAYVELDHWAVFGSFEQNRLVSVASMYQWESSQIADLGVLTLMPFRGKGHARNVVRSISKYAFNQGYEPQYRCQLDNQASISLAKAAGLTLFGKWEVISPDSVE